MQNDSVGLGKTVRESGEWPQLGDVQALVFLPV